MDDLDPPVADDQKPPAVPEGDNTPAAFDPESLSPEARAYFKQQLESEKYKARDTARRNAAEEAKAELAKSVAKALGMSEDEDVDPAALAEQVEQAQFAAWQSVAELQVYKVAKQLGADADRLLDSRSFLDSLEEVEGDDPRDPEFVEALKGKVTAALERNPGLKIGGTTTGPRPDPSQGTRGAGPTLDSRIAEAQAKGDWLRVISLQNQKLTK